MKIKKYLFFALLLAGIFSGCSEKSTDMKNEEDPNPIKYIDLLVVNDYDNKELPRFSPDELPALLKFGRDAREIQCDLANPFSSYKNAQNKVGFLALWTVEHIRKNYPYPSDDLSQQFPSQNPMILSRMNDQFEPLQDAGTLAQVHQLYQQWWENYGSQNFEMGRTIDPLEGSEYRWK